MESLTETFYLSMILIGVGCFLFGILPVTFSFGGARSYPFFLSLVLCLGAGVLLATSLVHMLTEVQEKLKLNSQLYFCAGFLALYTFDEISHYCLRSKKRQLISVVQGRERDENRKTHYGAAHASSDSSENSPLLRANQSKDFETLPGTAHCDHRTSQKLLSPRSEEIEKEQQQQQQRILDTYLNSGSEEPVQIICHVEAEEPWSPNSAARTGLLIALLIHSILEGVSIGVQTKASQVFLILGAVMFHKIVLSFCLGLELREFKTFHLLAAIFVFSIGSPMGIFLGMTVTSYENGIFGVDAELQAIAAGSLLYVATFEVLPRERMKYSNHIRGAGIFQLIFVMLGFTCITAAHLFLGSPEA